MKLSATQRDLLERAHDHPNGVVSVISGFITSRRHKRYGTRQRDAAHGLMKMGYFKHVETHKSITHLCHGFGADHGSDSVWEITESGKLAV